MFFIKKLVSAFLGPLPLCLLVAGVGLALLWFTRRQRAGKVLVTAGLGVLTVLGFGWTARVWLGPLEHQFRPLLVEGVQDPRDAPAREARWIVVLGGGHTPATGLPPTSQLNPISAARVVEALRLKRLVPHAKLLLSGGFGVGRSHGELLAESCEALGVPRQDLVVEDRTYDTFDEARFVHERIGSDPFILVTSASHLPRAVGLFRKQGMSPLASPADFAALEGPLSVGSFFPTASALGEVERAIHEYLGELFGKLRGEL
jgi:uncharacterized SAM-binding protein YcdF (DUF218 family)